MKLSLLRHLTLALGLLVPVAAHAAEPALTGVRYVYLIRHGVYDRDSSTDDRVGNGLNALGREQSQLIGERLAGLPVKMTTLVTSSYLRASQTADIVGRELKMTPMRDSLLCECTPTTERADVMRTSTDAERADCEAQLEAAWAKYVRPSPDADRHDVLVCHGNMTRWFVAKTLGLDAKKWLNMDIANCSLTVISVKADGTTRLVIYSDVGHVPVERQTWSGKGGGWGVKK